MEDEEESTDVVIGMEVGETALRVKVVVDAAALTVKVEVASAVE